MYGEWYGFIGRVEKMLHMATTLALTHTRRNTMPVRKANAVWEGTLKEGAGVMKLGSGAYDGPCSFASRFEEAPRTNP